MSASDTPLALSVEDGVATLRLSRPDAGNAIGLEMAKALAEMSSEISARDDIRCVLLTGSGRFFCVGGDIGAFRAAGEAVPQLLQQITAALHEAISHLARMPKPLVVAVNGAAAGAGLSLAALGDIVISARSASFTMAYTGIGLTPDGGATAILPRLIGLRRTQELAFTNRRLSADEAAAIGLVTEVVDDSELEGQAAALASRLRNGPVSAFANIRSLLMSGLPLDQQMDLEARTICDAAGSPEGREGIAAFLDKRRPVFS
ncbi:enoyl-CoA hydratase/isomerase family protein [Sphingopyxis sp.]|jgi:2-(1,2-epoxy-1,2-dihydrophenyl)acetyl-CoA isomerase|uniref:enoyl-CoA hydratase/isomerase family protein n=2 Tax=Alphaproteobacteria TaxID=28211 RepID=UPI003F6FA8EE